MRTIGALALGVCMLPLAPVAAAEAEFDSAGELARAQRLIDDGYVTQAMAVYWRINAGLDNACVEAWIGLAHCLNLFEEYDDAVEKTERALQLELSTEQRAAAQAQLAIAWAGRASKTTDDETLTAAQR